MLYTFTHNHQDATMYLNAKGLVCQTSWPNTGNARAAMQMELLYVK